MVEITMQVSESFARQIQSFGDWSAAIIELRVADFQFPSTSGAARELINFLSRNPSPHQVFDYFIADNYQRRLDDLLDLNAEGEIETNERQELDEWMKFDHISTLLKTQAAKLGKQNS